MGRGLAALAWQPGADEFESARIKVFDKNGKLIKESGGDKFTTVMNEIGYCAENDKIYMPEYGEKIWEMMASTASSS